SAAAILASGKGPKDVVDHVEEGNLYSKNHIDPNNKVNQVLQKYRENTVLESTIAIGSKSGYAEINAQVIDCDSEAVDRADENMQGKAKDRGDMGQNSDAKASHTQVEGQKLGSKIPGKSDHVADSTMTDGHRHTVDVMKGNEARDNEAGGLTNVEKDMVNSGVDSPGGKSK
ncbi:hypothetical protein A4A49_46840, partial [Nicotiana attenuata]